MRNTIMIALVVALALFAGGACAAQDGGSSNVSQVVTRTQSSAAEFDGSQYRQAVQESVALAGQNDTEAAWAKLKPALAYCDTKTDTATTQYLSVANADEVAEAVASHKGKAALAFVDTTCAVAYTNAGFLSVAAKDSEHALAYLIRAKPWGRSGRDPSWSTLTGCASSAICRIRC